jgi:uncharacterized protein (DUF924 family)
MDHREVLEVWFSDAARARWFKPDPAFDAELRARFGDAVEAAARGELADWQAAPESCLALVILLDQFTRNIHRGTAAAFAHDARALAIAEHALANGFDAAVSPGQRAFFYLPFEHAEDLAHQRRAVALFERLASELPADDEGLEYARKHLVIIERFGRFPHRNAMLGRGSTPEEVAFLREPDSSF